MDSGIVIKENRGGHRRKKSESRSEYKYLIVPLWVREIDRGNEKVTSGGTNSEEGSIHKGLWSISNPELFYDSLKVEI